jgi:hypothetical protein
MQYGDRAAVVTVEHAHVVGVRDQVDSGIGVGSATNPRRGHTLRAIRGTRRGRGDTCSEAGETGDAARS